MADCERLLVYARQRRSRYREGSNEDEAIVNAAELLCQLLTQDVERLKDGRTRIKPGVAKNRIVSVTDSEMRHGRKSKSQRFDGHKASVAVDCDSALITSVGVLAGNDPDAKNSLERVEQTEALTGCEVEKTIGDCALGGSETRRAFAEAGRLLVAKVPKAPTNGYLPKEKFTIDLENNTVTCPAGHQCSTWHEVLVRSGSSGKKCRVKRFTFDGETCQACWLHDQCVASSQGRGRSITLNPEEALLQQAREYQRTEAFIEDLKGRQVAKHRIARLIQLGMRKSRFFGRHKTAFQVYMAAAVANLTLIAAWESRNAAPAAADFFVFFLLGGLALIFTPRISRVTAKIF